MKITITEEDIKKGQQQSSAFCPVALAIKRETGDGTIGVGHEHLFRQGPEGGRVIQSLPLEAQDFIVAFDAGDPISPISFLIKD